MKKSRRISSLVLALVMVFSMIAVGVQPAAAAGEVVVTVGASGCDYTTITAALNAVSSLRSSTSTRVVIEIQPGDYQEQLYIDEANVTLRNASSNPSIALTNKGVGIDSNAVRITHYYGHGYNYYSMGSDYLYSDSVLSSNKSKGSASTTNPGAGSATHWNASVIIAANGFIAEDIIFENSFNQYISTKAAADTLVKTSSAKEGSTARTSLSAGSTTVQNKAYVERAAALAIKNNVTEAFFDHCKFVGRQDTLYGGKNVTAAFYDCEIYGACDYIFGGMTAVFAKCDLVFNTSEDKNDRGYITAAQQASGRGYLMYNCTITSTTPGVDTASSYASKPGYLGRPWAKDTSEVIFYNTIIEATCSYWSSQSKSLIMPEGWLSSLGGESDRNGEYGTYEVSGVDNSSSRADWANVFSSAKCADGTAITVSNFLGSWAPFSGKDMTITFPDGSSEEGDNSGSGSGGESGGESGGDEGGSSGSTLPAGDYVHIFEVNEKTSDFFTITGDNLNTSKGTATVNGTTYSTCFKMNSAATITFNAPTAGTFTAVFNTGSAGKTVSINGTTHTIPSDGVLTVDVSAGSVTFKRVSGESFLFYMAYASENSGSTGGDGGSTETLTATGSLNMSSVTVTKAAGAADPTTVDASLLNGLQMTVSYSNGTSKTVGLSDLTISSIKTHDTLGKYIDVDYMDATAGKVHTYILVTIEESADAHTHSYSSSVTTAATCTAAGVRTYTCSCGENYTESIAALGHNYSNGTCTRCGASDGSTETVTATGTINMSSVTVTKAAGAADPTTVDTALLSGLQMTVSYSNGTSKTVGLSDLTISGIKTHDSMGKYIDVDYNDPVTGTKIHTYILVTIQEAASGGDVVVPSGSYIHNFTDDGFTSDFYTFVGDQVTNGKHGTYTYDFGSGTETLNYALKLNSSGSVTFTPTAAGTLTIAVGSQSAGRTVVVNNGSSDILSVSIDTANQLFVQSVEVSANVTYTVKRTSGESGLYYIAYVPASSGDTHTHSYSSSVTTAATCTSAGVKTYTCSCGESYTESIAALGHSYSASVTAPTCTAQGYTTHTCGNCGDSYEDTYVAATGHTYVDGYCTVCGAADPDYVEEWNDEWTTVSTDWFTLNSDGTVTFTMAGTVAAGNWGHLDNVRLWNANGTEIAVENGDFENGTTGWTLTEADYCSIDATAKNNKTYRLDLWQSANTAVYVSVAQSVSVPAGSYYFTYDIMGNSGLTGVISGTESHTHSYTSSVTTAATCTSAGVKTYTCSCGESYTESIAATGHNYSSTVIAPTCTAQGYTTYTCSGCGSSYNSDYTNPMSHSYSSKVTAPSCTQGGYTTYTCGNCGDTYVANQTAALSHSYSPAVTTAPTCTNAGVRTYTCSGCGNSYTESIPALGHSYSGKVTAPTCTAQGYTTYTCSKCGSSYVSEYTNPTGHSYSNGYCTVCGAEDPNYTAPVELFDIAGANVKLGDSLTMYFYVKFADLDGTDYYAQITKTYADERGTVVETIPYADWEKYSTSMIRIPFDGIAAKEMADDMTVVIYNGSGEAVSNPWIDGIRTYAMRVFNNQNDKTKKVLADMLNYGAAAQSYFGYDEGNLANSQLTAEQQAYATAEVSATDHRVSGANYKGSTVVLKNSLTLNLYFANINQSMTARISYVNHYGEEVTLEVSGADFTAAGSMYAVPVTGMSVANGRQVVTCEVLDGSGNVVASAQDSVEGYIARMATEDEVMTMLMKFITSAYNYFHS